MVTFDARLKGWAIGLLLDDKSRHMGDARYVLKSPPLAYVDCREHTRKSGRTMLSWSLWKTIKNPPVGHPIFQRVSVEQPVAIPRIASRHTIRLAQFLLGVLAAILLIQNPQLILLVFMGSAFLVLSILVIPLLLPIAVFAYGAFLAATISNLISTEKEAHTYSLLCVSPGGSLSINWIIGSGVLHRGQTFDWLHAAIRTVLIIALFGMFVIVGIIIALAVSMLFGNDVRGFPDALRTSIELFAMLGIFYSGYIQSLVLAVIVGVLVPHYDIRKRDAQPTAATGYLALQFGTYLTAILIIVSLNNHFHGHSMEADLLLPPLYFIITYGIREVAIRWLWHQLIYRLNATPGDLVHLHVYAPWFPKNRSVSP